jgi:hypothetical protein
MSEEAEDIRQDLQENRRAGGRKVNSWIFRQDSKNECQDFVEELAPSETRKEATSSLRVGDAGALTILGTFARTDQIR